MNQRFGDKRRTELLVGEVLSLEDEDLIEEEEIVITLTNNGYIKRLANNEFRAQRRVDVVSKEWVSTMTTSSKSGFLFYP